MEKSVAYYVGLAAGIAAGILLVVLIRWLAKRVGGKVSGISAKAKDSYDERQLMVRGNAFKYAFFILAIYVNVAGVIDIASGSRILLSFGGMFLGTMIALCVFAIICIWQNAYMKLQENAKGVLISCGAIGMINLLIGIAEWKENGTLLQKTSTIYLEKVVESYTLSYRSINLFAGTAMLLVGIVFAIKMQCDRKIIDEDDDEE